MKKINKILAAIDLSSYSLPTLQSAIKIAQNTNAEIIVINIINQRDIDVLQKVIASKHMDDSFLASYLENETHQRTAALESLVRQCHSDPMPPIQIFIRVGVPSTEILSTVDEKNADFLVFGPKGETNLKRFLFGTVAEKLFRHSPVPVLSLRSSP